VKRGIFRRQSIGVCIEHRTLATPISPQTLPFHLGEEMVVATPIAEAPSGEYQFLFTIGEYLGTDEARARRLFDRPVWKHLYAIDSVTTVRPFSLSDVVLAGGTRGPSLEYRYKGQTQHHRIIRTIATEDEELWRSFIVRGTEPVLSAASVTGDNAAVEEERAARLLSESQLVAHLRRLSAQNASVEPGRAYSPGRSQRRNRRFVSLVKALYDGECQVCGQRLVDAGGTKSAAQVHHLEPWDGDRSDRLDNVICVCPNDHARFELGLLKWGDGQLHRWGVGGWQVAELAADRHLGVQLAATPAKSVEPAVPL
jgi:hypothetical protein